ncbi:peptidylprolyl isomerase [Mesorhizobium sp. Z1-4]|uniref:foldase protein PrsA n=1 Tax=Mesorhizobium sp. Z1-4 TaxID=2448478 RepID=UPI000FDA5834|nr:peptidylprolyl isomerase [Mesorhizobium sp. Z1-4]
MHETTIISGFGSAWRGIIAATVVFAAAMTASPSVLAQQEEIVARVDGQDITASELAVAEEMYAQQLGSMPDDAKRSVLVDALIDLRIVANEAREKGIAGDESFKRKIAFLEQQTLRSIFISEQIFASVTEEAVRTAYEAQIARMPRVEETRIRHILLDTEEAAAAVIEALNAGEDFAALARERSRDMVSRPKGGDLGFVAAGQSLPEIDAAAAKLQADEYTAEPVRSSFGFHVLKVQERRQQPAPEFETVAPQIRQSLQAAEQRRIIAELRAEAQVEKLVPDVTPPAEDDGHDH